MPSYKFRNRNTGEEVIEVIPHSSIQAYLDEHPDYDRVFEFPTINTSNSATFVDGHMPNSRKQALDIEKKIINLKAVEYGTRPELRGEIKQEIKNLESRRKAPIGTNKGSKEQ